MSSASSSVSPSIDEINKKLQDTKLDLYLFLPDDPFHLQSSDVTYKIFLPPTNSSGDIYHIISYLMLAKYKNTKLPLIQLSHDGKKTSEEHESQMNTYLQTQRCIQFAKHLGFKDSFLPPIDFGEDNKYRPNARYVKVADYLKENDKNENIYYCEQKLLTTLISYYFLTHGRVETTTILNKSYEKWFVSEQVNNEIKQKVQQEIETIKTKAGSKPLIIIQYRYSSKANNNQNIDEIEILNRLAKYLDQKDYVTWYLFVDSRAKESKGISSIDNKTYCFPYEIENHDYGKLFHLEFLLQILKLKNVKGIIGNTSGCLDLAAFVGHNVLNLHKFDNEMNYQSYRIFLQSSFLIVEDFNENVIKNILKDKHQHWIDFTDKIMNENMPIAAGWINNIKNTPTFPKQKFENFNDNSTNNAGFVDLHQIITWKNDELCKRKSFQYYIFIFVSFLVNNTILFTIDQMSNE